MFASTHAVFGAVLGNLATSNTKAFTSGLASHFVLDAIPHWGGVKSHKTFLKIAVIDGIAVLGITYYLYRTTPSEEKSRTLLGLIGAVFPDLNKPSILFFKHNPFPEPIQKFHSGIQTEAPSYAAVDAIFFLASGIALYYILRQNNENITQQV